MTYERWRALVVPAVLWFGACDGKASQAECERLAEHVVAVSAPRASKPELARRCRAELSTADVRCGLAAKTPDDLRRCAGSDGALASLAASMSAAAGFST